jgi:hypothetical protein
MYRLSSKVLGFGMLPVLSVQSSPSNFEISALIQMESCTSEVVHACSFISVMVEVTRIHPDPVSP